jgi:hypothetical protein
MMAARNLSGVIGFVVSGAISGWLLRTVDGGLPTAIDLLRRKTRCQREPLVILEFEEAQAAA